MKMARKRAEKNTSSSMPSKRMIFLVFSTMADTTWRLFVPTIGGTVLGLVLDKSWGTTPWLTTTGVILGAVLAFGLVYVQIRSIKLSKEDDKR
jgi:F0F1-type ATP synthase assembly protein I